MTGQLLTLDPSQRRAVDLVCTARRGIVTGGPGTGKSTCLRVALDRLDRQRKRYVLAAPTGKAAKRIEETTGRKASTIHRLLDYHPVFGFRVNASHPIESDVVVIDETSMLDIELGAALCSAIDVRRTALILIGDADQLPPVGPGRIFGDLVDSGDVRSVRLEVVHRTARESWVCEMAPRILAGRPLDLAERDDFLWCEARAAADVLPALRELVTHVAARRNIAPPQVLIPQRMRLAGTDAANRVLQNVLCPRAESDPFVPFGQDGAELRLGDRVIQTRNNYRLQVFNGEVGQVTAIDGNGIAVDFPDHESAVMYSLGDAYELQLAYALTVHKSQGSEFPWIAFVCHSTHSQMLTRQLAYTAITRAKIGVMLIGDGKGLTCALRNNYRQVRLTTLVERMRGELTAEG